MPAVRAFVPPGDVRVVQAADYRSGATGAPVWVCDLLQGRRKNLDANHRSERSGCDPAGARIARFRQALARVALSMVDATDGRRPDARVQEAPQGRAECCIPF